METTTIERIGGIQVYTDREVPDCIHDGHDDGEPEEIECSHCRCDYPTEIARHLGFNDDLTYTKCHNCMYKDGDISEEAFDHTADMEAHHECS